MESSLTTPHQVIHTTVMPHLYTDSFQTLLGQYLSSDLRLQLLVLQILQLIQDYQNMMPPTRHVGIDEDKNENHFNRNTKMLETQLVCPTLLWKENYYSTDTESEPGAQRMQGINFRSLRDKGWTPYNNFMQDEIDSSYENLERRKHNIERTQFLESDNNIYFKLEALMEKQKILVSQMRLNMINLQQHETELEKYYERKMGQEMQLINKVKNQREIIHNLKAQIQTCKNISSSTLLELKNKTWEINRLKFGLTNSSPVDRQLSNCTSISLGCLLELRNKDNELQKLSSKLENKEAQLEIMFNLSKFNNNVSEMQPIRSLLERISSLETQLNNCSISPSSILLELKNKSHEVEELTSKLHDKDAFEIKFKNCLAYSSYLSSQLSETSRNLEEQTSKLQQMESQLQACHNNSIPIFSPFNNTVNEVQLLISVMDERNNLSVQLQNCSADKAEQLSKLINKSNEVEELTSELKDKDILEVKLENCSNSTRNLQAQLSKLLDNKKQLETCFNNYSCILNSHNQRSDIQFLISLMRDNDDLKAQLQKCSTEKQEQLSKLTNTSNELRQLTSIFTDTERKLESCTNYSSRLFSQLKNCSSDTSSILPILNNTITGITFLIPVFKERDLLKAQLQNCSAETMQKISEIRNNANEMTELRARLRNQDALMMKLQNCSNYLSILNSEVNNRNFSFQEVTYKLLDVQTKLQTCSKNLSSALLDLDSKTEETERLTSMLNTQNNLQALVQNCYHTLHTTIYNNTRKINDLTTKLRNGQSCELQLQNCKNISLVLQVELENKTTEIQNLKLENKNYELQLLHFSNISYPVYQELWLNMTKLGAQLEICLEDSSTLLNELSNKTNIIQDLTLKLWTEHQLANKINECTALSPNLSMELVNETNHIQELASELIAQSKNEHNCSNILSPLLTELRNTTIQVQNLTSVLVNNTLIKNLQWELSQAEQKLVSTCN
jgi:chromosome segregation ATPase